MTAIAYSPMIGPVALNVVVREKHTSSLEITRNPIERGSEVNDHAYVKPKEVQLEVASENAAATFAALVAFQESRVPFILVTGLMVYQNMLPRDINADRDKMISSILSATIDLQEIKIASTASASSATGAPQDASKAPAGSTDSTRATTPSASSTAGDTATVDRASGTVTRGDNPTTSVPESQSGSILSQVFL